MIFDQNQLRLLDDVSVPDSLDVKITNDSAELMNLQVQLNSGMPQMFGTAYRQGGRLHFVTAMSVRDYLRITRTGPAPKGATPSELDEAFNRPKEKTHGKNIEHYLDITACQGLPFIFPAFIVNYGVGWAEDMPKALLTIFAGPREALAWPAIFAPPTTGGLPVTDGGHRTDAMEAKLREAAAGRLPQNGLSVIFVMESNIHAYHQDFSDCAKAKTISKSIQSTWDWRDASAKFASDLARNNLHLAKLIDASSNSVNLSNNSSKAWSMSAVHSAISSIYAHEENVLRLSDYLDACFAKVPILFDIANGGMPATHRHLEGRGGCVLLRGVGFAVLIQGYIHAVTHGMSFEQMANMMARIDWFVLKPNAPPQGEEETAANYVVKAAQPIWINMLAMMAGEKSFRIKGTKTAAEESFRKIIGTA
jgi:hypothetical protein